MHTSIRLETPCEFINVSPINPLISKCQIKVCYVGEQPNRNKSIITKEVATQMANSLPGCPIVGFYNEGNGDFEEHNRSIDISNGKFEIKDTTKPYGFVDLNAKCWFQKFLDDGHTEHEYLMTEGYLWTSQYPECQRIIEKGNNQSMELDEATLQGSWTNNDKGMPEFFIINEAVISKLCILGEECEPCFEGSNITNVQFSFDDGFKEQLFSMMAELKELLEKGGTKMALENDAIEVEALEEEVETEVSESYSLDEEIESSEEEVVETEEDEAEIEFKKKDDEEEDKDDESEDSNSEEEKDDEDSADEEEDDEGKKKKKYSLDEIPEYVELQAQFAELQERFETLTAQAEALSSQVASLGEFKAQVERAEKQEMIDKFYMLSEEDKKDVVENIDTYSLHDIEAELSILCVRQGLSFGLEDESEEEDGEPTTYSLESEMHDDESMPAWIKAVQDYKNSKN